ncbi:MAG: 4-diphosphocytidyl-2-C-methyl-D-erythritol kinase [Nitrospinaceae bacterium]|nr:MAG: 4-diphosphocytidyl-2-C-methyl-D-erythritol kinase [Nitrospinaceae bacterium]
MKLSFKTPAKINLALRILGRREDGYHDLITLLQMVTLFDSISLETIPSGVELQCDAPEIPKDHTNLVLQAAHLLQEAYPGEKRGVRIGLQKNIPSGAGLGGGSGNAAGALMGLNVFWDMKLSREDLVPLAQKLGSDVPFFLTAPCALGKGRGDEMAPVQTTAKFYVLLIYPGVSIATSWVYQNLKLKLTKRKNNISILQKFLLESQVACLGECLENDLEPVVFKRYPAIQAIREELSGLGADGCLLSGSGSTVFAIFDNPDRAKSAYAKFNKGNGGVFLTETVSSFSEFWPQEMLSYP